MSKRTKILLGVLMLLLIIVGVGIFYLKNGKMPVSGFLKSVGLGDSSQETLNIPTGELIENGKISESKVEKRIEEIKVKVEAESDPEKKKAIVDEEGDKLLIEAGLIK